MAAAIVVPGNTTRGRDGIYRISDECRRAVAEAGELAEELRPRVVVFSGRARGGGRSEAEQMRDAWRGPSIELVVEPTATITAENVSRTLPLLLSRGIDRAVVVCTPLHLPRVRYFFGRIYEPHGIETGYHVARVSPSLHAAVWELAALPVRRVQLRAARAELART
jgi:uncharacterized SAM-binding protein YcdF (DUF218 family)